MLKNRIWDAPILTRYAQSLSLPLAFLCAAALVVAVPWVMDPIHRTMRVFSIPKFTLINLFATLGIVALLINDALLNSLLRREGFPKKVLWLLGLWVTWMGITTALASYPARSWIGSYEWQLGMFTQIHLIAVCGLTFLILRRAHDGQRLLRIMNWGSIPVLIYGVMQYLGLDPITWTRWGDAGSVISTLGNENYFGAYLALLLPLSLSQLLLAKNFAERIGFTALMGLQVFCLAVTSSNGAIIAAMVACALVVWWHQCWTLLGTKIVLAGLIAISITATILIAMQGEMFGKTFWKASSSVREVRPFVWESAYNAVVARPFTGWGLSSFDTTHDIYASLTFRQYLFPLDRIMDRVHNLWLELALETGLVGLGMWLTMMVYGGNAVLNVVDRLKNTETRLTILGCMAACFGYVIYQVVNPSDLTSLMVFWWLIGLMLGLSFPSEVENNSDAATFILAPTSAGFILQILFLFTAVGAVYGLWQWWAN